MQLVLGQVSGLYAHVHKGQIVKALGVPVDNIHNLINMRKRPMKIIGIERGVYALSEAPFLSLHRQ